MNQLYQAMHRIYDAQNELSAATHLTSKLLKEYEKQHFPLGGDDEVMSSTLQQFSKVIDELSSCHAVLSTQLADAMMFPITQFKERDLKEILTLKEVFQIASNDHDAAINRYSRLSKKRENDKVKYEVTEDVYTSRKKQHQTMMHYFCALNTLQYKKKIALLEPLLGYMQAQISFFKMGSENLNEQLEEFLANIGTSVQKSSILQAESKKDHEEWICTINNISKQIYLSENPEETAARVNQSALEAVTPSPSFQQRHESLRPAGQSRLPTARTSSSGSLGSESTNLAALSLDSLVAPDTPIQFDIISPVCEDLPGQAKTSGQGGRRTNPFGESGGSTKSETEDSILHQLFIVRFLGSMEVKSDDHPDVVYETMRQILAARAIHNIFRMTESHLLVTCDCLKLIDPQTQVTRLTFPLPCVVLYATHQENKRLFGFVLRTSGGRSESNLSSVCYIFESNNEGEKICDSVGLAKQIALHAELDRRASEKQKEIERVKEKQQKELNKQKQIEKDLEEQSRLIAASSRTNQASSEGQFVVLSSSQSEESDLGEEGKKRESEA
ncbi:DCC-interacting protein 13-alpha isoform X6 [Marmota marmota marmota]|uniref:DCC-interacting protein 13-alpha isoform X6 n=1 Tax=Marmota marmota marmota TaxID=9994 RepID=UPI00209358CC|nr:DCC-interacting protein 13-alpha isoform X6 [Marmota marmota marmota]